MSTILSQKVNKEGIDYIYECSITDEDLVCFSYRSNTELIDKMIIDFPNLRNFINNKLNNYEADDFMIKDGFDYYRIYSKRNNDMILVPKIFLLDSYNILREFWIDD